MEKIITLDVTDRHGRHFYTASEVAGSHGIKLAEGRQWSAEVENFVRGIKPDPRAVVVFINAMGAGEWWGPNSRGDYFSESELLDNFHTFERNAKLYRNHANKDPNKSLGDVLFAHYNPEMHRVELVVRIWRDKAGDICDAVDAGNYPSTSMGCKVKKDICSACGHVSKTLAEYCIHLKEYMNKILEDGRQIYAENIGPSFFDISVVPVGADRTSRALRKVASSDRVISGAEEAFLLKAARMEAASRASGGSCFPWGVLVAAEAPLPALSPDRGNKWSVLSDLGKLAIMPSLREFAGLCKAAGIAPSDSMDADFHDPTLNHPSLKMLGGVRSALSPYLDNRIVALMHEKTGGAEVPLPGAGGSVEFLFDDSVILRPFQTMAMSKTASAMTDDPKPYANLYVKYATAMLESLQSGEYGAPLEKTAMSYLIHRLSPARASEAMRGGDPLGFEKFASAAGGQIVLADMENQDFKKEALCRMGLALQNAI